MRYQIRNAKVQFGADTILNSVNFEIHDTEKIAIVGRNGCGKTTLLRLIASGEIDTTPLITHIFPLQEIDAAYALFEGKRDHVMKVAVTM